MKIYNLNAGFFSVILPNGQNLSIHSTQLSDSIYATGDFVTNLLQSNPKGIFFLLESQTEVDLLGQIAGADAYTLPKTIPAHATDIDIQAYFESLGETPKAATTQSDSHFEVVDLGDFQNPNSDINTVLAEKGVDYIRALVDETPAEKESNIQYFIENIIPSIEDEAQKEEVMAIFLVPDIIDEDNEDEFVPEMNVENISETLNTICQVEGIPLEDIGENIQVQASPFEGGFKYRIKTGEEVSGWKEYFVKADSALDENGNETPNDDAQGDDESIHAKDDDAANDESTSTAVTVSEEELAANQQLSEDVTNKIIPELVEATKRMKTPNVYRHDHLEMALDNAQYPSDQIDKIKILLAGAGWNEQ